MSEIVHRLEVLPVSDLLVEELVHVQTTHLRLLTDTEVHARDVLESVQQNARYDKRVSRNRGDSSKLLADLHALAVDSAGSTLGTVECADGLVGEDSREEGAHHAANAMQLEDVQAFVDVQPVVEVLKRGADDGGEEADERCEPEVYVACGGRDADETRDGAFARTDDGEFALGADVVDEDPADGTG